MIPRAIAIMVALLAPAALIAEQRAQVTGAIQDTSDAVLVDAVVTVTNEDTGIRRSTRSDGEGGYAIGSLPPGSYKITVRKEGFQTMARLNVVLQAAQNARIDFTMQVGSMRETITIRDGPQQLNTMDGSVGLAAGRDLIDQLPLNGRGVLSLLDLAPGVVATPAAGGEAGQFSANGQRANTNYFTVDGVSANTSVSGAALPAQFAGGALPAMTAFGSMQNLITTDDLQEANIRTSSFAPEFGRMPGAHVALATRSGSNEMHGSLFYAFRNERLNANDWFANRYGVGIPAARLNDWGGSLGGPVRRDRTFFFASYEGLRLTQPFTWIAAVPSEAARASSPPAFRPLLDAFPLPNLGLERSVASASRPARLDSGSFRVDHALTARNSLFARYNQAPSSTAFGYSQIDSSEYQSSSFTLGLATLLPAAMLNDLRVNVSGATVSSRWLSTNAGGAVPLDFSKILPGSFPSSNVLYGFGIANLGQILSGDSGTSRQGQWTIVETLAINRGAHAIRLGTDYDRLRPARDAAEVSLAGRYLSLNGLLAGQPMVVTESQSDRASSLIQTLSFFVQDTWRIHSRFTVTYGTRWELTPSPNYRATPASASEGTMPAFRGLWPTRYTQFAPRIGAAYRLSSRSVLRAGWGVFYDLSFSVATDPINGFAFNRWQFTGAPVNTSVPLVNNVPAYSYAPDLRLPRSLEWNLAYEHAVSPSDVVALSYVGSSGRNLLRREGTLQSDTQTAQRIEATSHGDSRYDGLEVQYRRKLARGMQGLLAYTWSHSLDNGSWDSAVALVQPGITAARDWASSSFDVRHSFNAACSWTLFRDWTVEAILRVRSGFPVDVLVNQNVLGVGFDNITRPDLVPGLPLWVQDAFAPGGRHLNPAAFAVPSGILQGNLGRNVLSGFAFSEVDVAVRRDFRFRNEEILQLRIEGFNALNHPEFSDPVRFLDSPLFGQAASMLNLMLGSGSPHSGLTPAFQIGGPRQVQISLRLRF